jgi:Holliday junction resolvasome RuvABC endonuclease subunit
MKLLLVLAGFFASRMMTGVAANPNSHLANMLNDHHQRLSAIEHQQQSWIHDNKGKCVVIEGNLQFDNNGVATGLGLVFGIASKKTGSWVQVA